MMKEKNIRELAKRMGLITVENMCQYTIAQLVYMVANKVNELIGEVGQFESDVVETVKTQNENIQYLLGEGLHLEVATVFEGWMEDGTFNTLINQTALNQVNKRLELTNAQLTEIANKGTTVEVLERATKEEIDRQLSDGTIANLTIANNSITDNKYKDESVMLSKLGGDIYKNIASYQPIDVNLMEGYYDRTTGVYTEFRNYFCCKIECKKGEKYLVSGGVNGQLTALILLCQDDVVVSRIHEGQHMITSYINNEIINIPDGVNNMRLTFYYDSTVNIRKYVVNNTNEINEKIMQLQSAVYHNTSLEMTYDSSKVNFTYNDNKLTASIIDVKKVFHPCFFNHNHHKLEFTFVNDDLFVIIGKNNDQYLGMGIGSKGGTENITGRMVIFNDTNATFKIIKEYNINPPILGDVVGISAKGSRITLSYNKKEVYVMDVADFEPYGLDWYWHLGVTTTTENYTNPNGLMENIKFDTVDGLITVKDEVEQLKTKVDLMDSLNNHWLNKKANFLGDSITQGVGTNKCYHEFVKDQLNLSVSRNYGVGGTIIANREPNNFLNRYQTMDDDADLVVVFGGTNDFGHHTPLGDINSEDNTTFYGAIKELCGGLINKYTGKTILFITPMNRNCNMFPADGCPSGQKHNNEGHTLEDYVKALKEVTSLYSIPVYDLFSNSNLYPYNPSIVNNYIPDGLHPNENGHKVIARKISNFINQQ